MCVKMLIRAQNGSKEGVFCSNKSVLGGKN